MAFDPNVRLDAGDAFPATTFALPDGSRVSVPGDYDGRWLIMLFYRGHW